MAKVMIDPGHTAWNVNPGVVQGYFEGTMAWTLSGYLQQELQAYGIQADRTKKHINHALDVVPRGRMAEGYDMFVSLHSDACGTESVDRVTVFHMVDDDWSGIDEKSKALAEALAPAVASVIGTHDKPQIKSKAASGDRNGNGRHDDNWLGVLYGAHEVGCPGILIEHSFHTNRRSCEWLLQDDHLRQLAKVEASVIAEYFGIALPSGFVDIPDTAWYAEAVKWATEKGLTSGTGNHRFSPDQACTRAQAMTMLWRLAGSPEPDGTYRPFADVHPTSWCAKPIQWAVQHGITNGTGGGDFSPNAPCTRAQIVTFLWRAAGSPAAEGDEFDDVSKDDYFHDAVHWAFARGITSGIYTRHFGPNEPCTRAMIVTMLRAAEDYI